ncbi:MAG TPA: isoprenylcysteine carboxylmethyltransferase family protein [Candidatus Nitrosotalea sp.]|nr:isoprenylcysteine carboxylmethyltransferase family protein [Candidatus Nitrosotalea sp.]
MRPPPWYVGVVALMAVQRLVELRLSRAHEIARGGTQAAPKSYPIMVAAHVGLLTLPLLEVSGRPSVRPRLPWAALLLAAGGLRIWSIRSLGPEWNVRAAVPLSLQPVARGPYALIRHPNYLAVIAEFAALPMVAGARVSALALSTLNAFLLWHRIRAEEQLLQRSSAYQEIFAQRSRFIPRVF